MVKTKPAKEEFQGTLIRELNDIFQGIYKHWCKNEESQDWEIKISFRISSPLVENIIWNIELFWKNTRISTVLMHEAENRRDCISSNKGRIYLVLNWVGSHEKSTFTVKKLPRKSARGN